MGIEPQGHEFDSHHRDGNYANAADVARLEKKINTIVEGQELARAKFIELQSSIDELKRGQKTTTELVQAHTMQLNQIDSALRGTTSGELGVSARIRNLETGEQERKAQYENSKKTFWTALIALGAAVGSAAFSFFRP
jgi:chromosome segregation ATPase